MNSKPYVARVSRDGKWWMIDVDTIGLTQARRYSDVKQAARELIAAQVEVDIALVEVDIELHDVANVDVDRAMREIEKERTKAAELEDQAAAHQLALIRDLTAAGVPLRDVGAMIGVSHQRIHQIMHSAS